MMNIFIILALIFWNIFLLRKKILHAKIQVKIYYVLLLIVHFTAFLLFYQISLTVKKDSFLFYNNALNASSILDFSFLGSQFMSILAYPFAKTGVSYFSISLLTASLSFYIFIKYVDYFIDVVTSKKRTFQTLLLLLFLTPSLHFWTAGFSKEAVLVFLMGIIFFEVMQNKFFSLAFLVALLFILLIRPYLFVIIVLALGLQLLVNKAIPIRVKKIGLTLAFLCLVLSLPILKKFLVLNAITLDVFRDRFQDLVAYSSVNGKSSIDLINSNYFERLWQVLFRPFFYDARSFFQYVVSIENLIFLVVLMKFVFDIVKRRVSVMFSQFGFLLTTSLILILFYSMYMYNLGLASRMRTMFMPYLYIVIYLSYAQKNRYNE